MLLVMLTACGGGGGGGGEGPVAPAVPGDNVAPTVMTGLETPLAGTPAASIWTPITFTFSEEMDPASIIGNATTISVVDNLGPLPGVITSSDNKTFRFLCSEDGFLVPFDPLSPVIVTISTAARDLAGNPLTAPVTWSFTVGPNEPPPPPN